MSQNFFSKVSSVNMHYEFLISLLQKTINSRSGTFLKAVLFLFLILSALTGCGGGNSSGGNTGASSEPPGYVALSWKAPLYNENGTVYNDQGGYYVYAGPSSRNYTKKVRVSLSSCQKMGYMTECSAAIAGLIPGQPYYLAATAYDKFGNESGYSPEIIKEAL